MNLTLIAFSDHCLVTKGHVLRVVFCTLSLIGIVGGIISSVVYFPHMGIDAIAYSSIGFVLGILFLCLERRLLKKIDECNARLASDENAELLEAEDEMKPKSQNLDKEISQKLTYLHDEMPNIKKRQAQLKYLNTQSPDIFFILGSYIIQVNSENETHSDYQRHQNIITSSHLNRLSLPIESEFNVGNTKCRAFKNAYLHREPTDLEILDENLALQMTTYICKTGFFRMDHVFFCEHGEAPLELLILDQDIRNPFDLKSVIDGLFGTIDAKVGGLFAKAVQNMPCAKALKIILTEATNYFSFDEITKELEKRPYFLSFKAEYPIKLRD